MFKLPTLRALKRGEDHCCCQEGQDDRRKNDRTDGRRDEPIKAPSFPARRQNPQVRWTAVAARPSTSSVGRSVCAALLLEHVKLARRAAMAGAASADIADGRTDRGMTVNIGFEARVLAGCLSCQAINIPNYFTTSAGCEAKPFMRGRWLTDIPYSRPNPRGGVEDHLLAHARTQARNPPVWKQVQCGKDQRRNRGEIGARWPRRREQEFTHQFGNFLLLNPK